MVRSLSLPKRRLHIVIPGLTGNLLLQSVQVKTLGVFLLHHLFIKSFLLYLTKKNIYLQ